MVNRLIPRVNAIAPTYLLGPENLAKIQSCGAEFDVVVAVWPWTSSPRTRALDQIIPMRDDVRTILAANKV